VFPTERPYFGNLALKAPDAGAAVKLAWDSSPEAYVNTWKSPVVLIHGDATAMYRSARRWTW